jgi:hypothetical protein
MYLWQLPQNILGILFLLFIRGEERHSLGGIDFYYAKGFAGGISLGKYIILGEYYKEDVKHEYGHSIQSRYLGWLYLIVVGLPSLLWAMFYRGDDYYKFYTEKNADKLGGVER